LPEQNPRASADTIPKVHSVHFQKFLEPIFSPVKSLAGIIPTTMQRSGQSN